MYIAAGQGQTTPGDIFWCQQKPLVATVVCYKFKKISLIFYTIFFMILYMYIAPRQGRTTPWGWFFYVNRNILSLWSYVASFKTISLKSDFIQFFHDCLYVYSPAAGADSPQGTKFWCQQECLVTSVICCKFQTHVFEVLFYTIFHNLIHVCSPGAKFWCQQKCLVTSFICCKFKKISVKSDFIQLFSWFYTCI